MSTSYRVFAQVPPGLEPLLVGEIERLFPDARPKALRGGVETVVAREGLWRLARSCRIAGSLRVRVGRFHARSFAELEEGLGRVAWSAWISREAPVEVRASASKSRLHHTGAIIERAEGVLARRREGPPREDLEPVRVFVRLERDRVTVSVDAAGELLHKRGYRVHVGRAPLRENLAAACLAAAGLPQGRILWDPFCGSGTLCIEHALRPDTPLPRSFAFERWPSHDADAYAAWAVPPGQSDEGLVAIGSDRSRPAIDSARANLAALPGLSEAVRFEVGDFERVGATLLEAHGPLAIVTNLPYGKRLAPADVASLYPRFGAFVRRYEALGPVLALTSETRFPALAGGSWERALSFDNRGTRVTLWRLASPSG